MKKSEDSFEIMVKEKPQRGEANKKVIVLLAAYLGVSVANVRLRKGFTEKNKIFEIINL